MDKKVWTHYSAYDPGRPRDIEAINAGRRKTPKKSSNKKGGETETSRTTHMQVVAERIEGQKERTSKIANQEMSKGVELSSSDQARMSQPTDPQGGDKESGHQTKESVKSPEVGNEETVTQEANFHVKLMSQQLLQKRRLGPDDTILVVVSAEKQASSSKFSTNLEAEKRSQTAANTEEVKARMAQGRDAEVRWEVKAKPRILLDSKFHYRVELTREKDDQKWVLNLFESTSVLMPKSYKYCARRYDGKGNVLLVDDRDPVPSLRTALKYFSDGFRGKTGYNWDERLLRSGLSQPKWRYRAPAVGKATGRVPPEYTPGDPKCVKAEDLEPIGLNPVRASNKAKNVNEAPNQRPPRLDKKAQWQKMVEEEKANSRTQKKRKADNSPSSEPQAKMTQSILPFTPKKAGKLGLKPEVFQNALKVNINSAEEGEAMSMK